MDATINNIVHFSLGCVCLEIVYRVFSSNALNVVYWNDGGLIFFYSYTLCILTQLLGFKDLTIISKSEYFRSTLSLLHALDGVAALLIGISLYYRNKIGLWMSLLMITKFFLIHLVNRLILASKKDNNNTMLAEFTQTTKSFLHHVASFLFISNPTEIIITSIWRTISMTGHATLVLRGRLDPKIISKINWFLAYVRILMVIFIIVTCVVNIEVRDSFGRSAVGHIAYMMVRLGPVYITGSMYLNDKEKLIWMNSTEKQKIQDLLTGKYFWFSIEMVLLVFCSIYFAYLRISLLMSDNNIKVFNTSLHNGNAL